MKVLKKQSPREEVDKKIHFYNTVGVSSMIQIFQKNIEQEHSSNSV